MEHVEPVIGWRLWWARGDVLHSWSADAVWQPGDNGARCLVDGHQPCAVPPGAGCHCGFWATHGPAACLRLAGESWDVHGPMPPGRAVLGLVAGWGDVALHGGEGFRARYARVLVLFDDVIGLTRLRPMRRIFRGRALTLGRLHARYGVPVVSLGRAIESGVLAEMGVRPAAIAEAAAMLRREAVQYPPALKGGEPVRPDGGR
jgi:hypothetical protein